MEMGQLVKKKLGWIVKWMDSDSLANSKAFRKYRLWNEYGQGHPLEPSPFFMGPPAWRTKKRAGTLV
jgi:hypothetical protein